MVVKGKKRRLASALTGGAALLLTLWLTACGGSSSSPRDNAVDAEEAQALQAALDEAVSACRVPGAVMAVRTPEGKVWKGASGIAEYERNISMRTDMHFHIGSVTKTFTATAIMMLMDRNASYAEASTSPWIRRSTTSCPN